MTKATSARGKDTLTRAFFARSVDTVARELIGVLLLVDGVGGRIVEVESYDHEDPAAHGRAIDEVYGIACDEQNKLRPFPGMEGLMALPDETIATEPILRRLSEPELQMVEAADLFNASQYRRTVGGIAKSLGEPRASVVPLSGVSGDVVVTVAWDISWYQYRVTPESDNPVRLEDRGHDPADLEGSFQAWNAHFDDDGRVVPDIARL